MKQRDTMMTTILDHCDLRFSRRLEQWTPLRRALYTLFSNQEIETLRRSERSFRPGARQVVFLAFENRIASLGGLTPVMKYLPYQLKREGEKVVFVSPFHAGHSGMKNAAKAGLLEMMFENQPLRLCGYESVVTCYRDTSADIPSYYLAIPGRFTAGENPYAYAQQEDLLLDALAFCAAVPVALSKLGMREHLLFHAHEWETSLVAITSRMAILSALLAQTRTVLTLHNSFDAGIPSSFQKMFFGKDLGCATVLQCAIPFLNGPLMTVSTPFAVEVARDPLQVTVFTDHLQDLFSMNPPLGIENGVFNDAEPPVSPSILTMADAGNYARLRTRKNTFRRRFIKVLQRVSDRRIIGRLSIDPHDVTTPIFYMAGRLDFMQKGFDVMFRAFERLPRGSAKLLFCPSSRSGGKRDELRFFRDIEQRCKGDIEIWPFKIPRRLYDMFLRGASFLLMPSLYEPFGSANEGMIQGTPVVARATGGLWLQVNSAVPVEVPAFYGAERLIEKSVRSTGILFRESYPDDLAAAEWRALLERSPQKRCGIPLYEALVDAAFGALENALTLFAQPSEYLSLIRNGFDEVRKFSWERAAKKHLHVYDVATNRGM